MSCSVCPTRIVAPLGVTASPVSKGGVTVSEAVPLIPFRVALIVAAPAAMPLAKPPLPTVATLVAEEDQVTELVMSFDAPSA